MAHLTDVLINDFALRSLRETADKDYVHARLAFRARLMPQFFWSSLHCLEKYTKCVLVLNRIDAKKVKHEVLQGLSKLQAKGSFAISLSPEATGFVDGLESGARFRYYEASYDASWEDLALLDLTVWELRRYCQPLRLSDGDADLDGMQSKMFAASLNQIRETLATGTKDTCISDGWLERILEQRTHSSHEPLIWLNERFGQKPEPHSAPEGFIEAGNSPLFLHPEIVDEVAKYVYLPREVVDAYRQLKVDRDAGKA